MGLRSTSDPFRRWVRIAYPRTLRPRARAAPPAPQPDSETRKRLPNRTTGTRGGCALRQGARGPWNFLTRSGNRPSEYLAIEAPEDPVLFFAPQVLQATAKRFLAGFPGLVTYAVKSNPDPVVVENLARGRHPRLRRRLDLRDRDDRPARAGGGDALQQPGAQPCRDRARGRAWACARSASIRGPSWRSWARWCRRVARCRFASSCRSRAPPTTSAPSSAPRRSMRRSCWRERRRLGFIPSLTFHPGTQCTDPMAWDAYIRTAARIGEEAGVQDRAAERRRRLSGAPAARRGAAAGGHLRADRPGDRRSLRRRAPGVWSASRAARWWPRRSAWRRRFARCATGRTCS